MKRSTLRAPASLLAVALILTLPACGSDRAGNEETAAEAEPSNQTLSATLQRADDLSTIAGVIQEAGLAKMFEGSAAYTILAPRNAAFDALGEAGAALREPEQRAAMLAILRDHIVPGYLTPKDIRTAIDRGGGKPVKMKTMTGQAVTFTRDGETINVAHENGATARLVGDAVLASNGVALPIEAVLRKL